MITLQTLVIRLQVPVDTLAGVIISGKLKRPKVRIAPCQSLGILSLPSNRQALGVGS